MILINRLAFFFGLLVLCGWQWHGQVQGQTEDAETAEMLTSQDLLPASTKGWISIPNIDVMVTALGETDLGQMVTDPELEPFLTDLRNQLKSWLNEQNVKFGLEWDDVQQVYTGEVCLAGVTSAAEEGVEAHALVLLIDVSNSQEKAEALLEKVSANLVERKATLEDKKVEGFDVAKWVFEKPRGLRKQQFAFHALAGDWFVASDNEKVFTDVIRRISEAAAEANGTLANSPAFQFIQGKARGDEENITHVQWFVEPFGYVDMAQAIAEAENPDETPSNDYARIIREEGFSAIKGLGGVIKFAAGPHDILHRSFIYAPAVPEAGEDKYLRAAAMLDFSNTDAIDLNPPAWVPDDAATYFSITWNLEKVLDKVGFMVDAVVGNEGTFERTLKDFKDRIDGPRVDLRALVSKFENRVTVVSQTDPPFGETSENIIVGIRIIEDEDKVAEWIKRLVGDRNEVEVQEFNGKSILIVSQVADDPADDVEFDLDDLDLGIDDEEGEEYESEEEEIEVEEPKPLFEQKVIIVTDGYLLVGNNVDFVKRTVTNMENKPGDELAKASDFSRIRAALGELADESEPSVRLFVRLDKSLRTNYEMMRQGKMVQSKTLMAQILNRSLTPPDQEEDREQKIDGAKLPSDFDHYVGRFLGPSGSVIQCVDEGWLITGCMLKKIDEDAPVEIREAKKE